MARSKKLQAVSDDTKTENIGGTKLDLKELEKAGFTMLENSTYATVDNRIPSGLVPFDLTMNGGLPMGRVTEIAAPNGVGKSNLAVQYTKMAISMGIPVTFIDVEGTADKEHLAEMGIDITKVFVKQVDAKNPAAMSVEAVGEAIEGAIDLFAKHNLPTLIIWDSVGATPGKKTLDADFDSEQPGIQAKAVTRVMQKVTPKITGSKSALLIINQVRDSIGGMSFVKTYDTPGGKMLEHSYSLRYMLGKAGDVKSGQEYMGHKVKFTNKKSKVSKPFQKAVQFLYGGMGFNEMVNIIFTGEELGLVKAPTAGGRKVEVPNEETGEIEKFPYFEFLDYISTPEGAEEYMYFLRPTFHKIIKELFPKEFPPLNNTEIDVTLNPLYQGLEELYKPEPVVEEPKEEATEE